ncbi:unnamed protein product [Effrenium voratum]|uniref:DNA (cytosine-5-)-methyltransferase n=1 Tax=Effrenium voratum TaxID=2562239 RepID=A0AA36J1C2_9DINO|nr:unnamed protein product [Effrenium voratum]CAJ1460839.1 unnamed protein product [Effrenium voratum]
MAPLQRALRIGTDCSGMETPVMALQALKVHFEHSFSCDTEASCKAQICANFPAKVWYDDLLARDNESKQVPAVDLYVCGFPCQPFSSAGLRKGFKDERGNVFFGCARYIAAKLPRVFVLENVKGLLSNKDKAKRQAFKVIEKTLKEIGDQAYHVEFRVMDTQDHGVPQSRPRVYIVGIRKNVLPASFQQFEWPKPLRRISINQLLEKKTKKVTMEDLPSRSSQTVFRNTSRWLRRLQQAGKDPLNNTFILDIDASTPRSTAMRDRCPCMTKSRANGFWVSSRGRRMTIKEMLRCQGMELCFKQVVSNRVLGAHIGNAMSQNILERIFIKLLPLAGLVPSGQALVDRWAKRAKEMPASKEDKNLKKLMEPRTAKEKEEARQAKRRSTLRKAKARAAEAEAKAQRAKSKASSKSRVRPARGQPPMKAMKRQRRA